MSDMHSVRHDHHPKIVEEWAVVDRWWTDTPEHRVYVAIQVDGQECVLRYDQEDKTFSIQNEAAAVPVEKKP